VKQATIIGSDAASSPTRSVLTQQVQGAGPVDVGGAELTGADLLDQVLGSNASKIRQGHLVSSGDPLNIPALSTFALAMVTTRNNPPGLYGVLVAVQTPEAIQVPLRPQLHALEELPQVLLAIRGVQDHLPDRPSPFLVSRYEVLVLLVVFWILPSHSVICVMY